MLKRFWTFLITALHQRDERSWKQWESLRARDDRVQVRLGVVDGIRQNARRGCKGYMSWFETGEVEAFWIPNRYPRTGDGMLVRGSLGNGAHHGEDVFYISVIEGFAPSSVRRGWRRHEKRRRKEASLHKPEQSTTPVIPLDATLGSAEG